MSEIFLKLSLFGVLLLVQETTAVFCSYGYKHSYSSYMYCADSCCGTYYHRYCCHRAGVGTIIGAVIGTLVIIGLIIAVSVLICAKKTRQGMRGRVIVPQPNPRVSVVHNTSTQHQYGYAQPAMAAYNQMPGTSYGHPPPGQRYPYPPPPVPPPSYSFAAGSTPQTGGMTYSSGFTSFPGKM